MFRNLEAEIKRNGLTKGDLAKLLKMQNSTLSNKLNGKSPITLEEAKKIKSILAVNMSIDELFQCS